MLITVQNVNSRAFQDVIQDTSTTTHFLLTRCIAHIQYKSYFSHGGSTLRNTPGHSKDLVEIYNRKEWWSLLKKKHASCKCPIFRDSLTGVLRESPRPNILEKIQDRLDSVDGIKPLWRLAPGQVVSKLAKFTSDTETQSVTDIKGRVDRDLQGYYYHHQSSYICYILVPPRVTLLLMMVDRSYPRLQPIFGFELAISAISWCR